MNLISRPIEVNETVHTDGKCLRHVSWQTWEPANGAVPSNSQTDVLKVLVNFHPVHLELLDRRLELTSAFYSFIHLFFTP